MQETFAPVAAQVPVEVVTPVAEEVAAEVPAVFDPLNFSFKTFEKIDYQPEYYENVFKMFKGRPTIGKGDKQFTKDQVFAIQAVQEMNARYPGIGTYKEFKAGTSQFQQSLLKRSNSEKTTLPFSDEQILTYLTTLQEKGPIESFYRRITENIPVSAGMVAGYNFGKAAQPLLPTAPPFRTGHKGLDIPIIAGQAIYNAGKFTLPYITGIVGSMFTAKTSEEFGELFLGEKGLATPGTRPLQRYGEAVADVTSFSPIGFFADKAAGNMVRDFFTNRLNTFLKPAAATGPATYTFKAQRASDGKGGFFNSPSKTVSLDQGPGFGRPIDMTGTSAKKGAYTQLKEAEKVAGEYNYKGAMIKGRKGQPFQGPVTINQLNQRGVADVLAGKVPQGTMRKLLAIEDALRAAGTGARKNPELFAFYEALAATGAGVGAKGAAENNPFTGYELGSEIGGSIALPMFGQGLLYLAAKKAYPMAREMVENISDMGLITGVQTTLGEGLQGRRDAQGLSEIVKRLQEMGTIDSPEQLEEFVRKLEAMPKSVDARPTAGQLTGDPVIMAMEAALARDFPELSNAQRDARKLEVEALRGVLEQLSFAEGTQYGREALRIGAEIKESIFENTLTARLDSAEDKLLSALQQLKKSKLNKNQYDSEGQKLTAAGRAALNAEDRLDLSTRLMNMLMTQKKFAREEQKKLYDMVGEIDLSQFYNNAGEPVDGPKLLRLLQKEGPFAPGNTLEKDLAPLFTFARSLQKQLGVQMDLGGETPKLATYNDARLSAFESGGMDLFDRFVVSEIGAIGSDNLPETVTPSMIRSVTQKIGQRGSKGRNSPTGKAYTAFRDALLEKGARLGTIDAGPAVRTAAAAEASIVEASNFSALETAAKDARDAFDSANSGDFTLPAASPRSAVNLERIIQNYRQVPLDEFDGFVQQSLSPGAGPNQVKSSSSSTGDDYLRAEAALIKAQRTADAATPAAVSGPAEISSG